MEITIIISTALIGVSAMFAFVNCGEVSSVLTKNCFDFHVVVFRIVFVIDHALSPELPPWRAYRPCVFALDLGDDVLA